MAEKISFTVDLSGLANYTVVEGVGTSSLLKQDGYYSATINKVTLGKAASGNSKFILSLTVQDADEKGASLISDVLVSGTDKNGNPNIRQFGDLLASMGMTQDAVRQFAANGQQPGDNLAGSITGKTVYVNAEAETWEGNTRTKVRGYISQQRYADSVAANAHRKPRKADVAYVGAPAGMTPAPTPTPVPGMVFGGSPANSGMPDPMARISGLSLKL